MQHLFEDGVYFIGGRHRGRRLFEGGIYLSAAFDRVNTVIVVVLAYTCSTCI